MNREDKIYIAGSLFNEAEVAQRILEEESLKEILGFNNIYNPINAPCNDKAKLPTAKDIFGGDTFEILKSDIVIADLSNATDLGVACEMGIVWTCNFINELAKTMTLKEILEIIKPKEVVAHLSDIRKGTAHSYEGNHIPIGFNQYLIGCIEDMGMIKDNFGDALVEVSRRLEN